jgi:hypothetical protein
MNKQEAKRRAYGIAAGLIRAALSEGASAVDMLNCSVQDARRIEAALEEIASELQRHGARRRPSPDPDKFNIHPQSVVWDDPAMRKAWEALDAEE